MIDFISLRIQGSLSGIFNKTQINLNIKDETNVTTTAVCHDEE